jgi:hypothetical protein
MMMGREKRNTMEEINKLKKRVETLERTSGSEVIVQLLELIQELKTRVEKLEQGK